MAIFKPIHVVESKLGNVSKVAGQLIITTDVGNIYFDASTSNRILIANKYTLPVATSNALGGIKSGAALSVDSSGNVTITANGHTHTIAQLSDLNVSAGEINQLKGVVSNVQNQLDAKLNTSLKGVANGLAILDSSGHVPTSQLPSYVDDVLEFNTKSGFPKTGEAGKIYVDLTTNLTYRWSGTEYIEISPSIALGRTSSTAFPGDAGKALEDKINKTVGSTSKPVYLSSGTFTECGSSLGVSITGNAATASKLNTDAGSSTQPVYFSNGVPTLCSNTLANNISGTATNATNINATVTNPSSATTYYLPWVSNSGSQGVKVNNGITYHTLEGTTSANGYGLLILGNGTASGTAGNKYGQIRLFGTNTGYTDLIPAASSAAISLTLPSSGGTLAKINDTVTGANNLMQNPRMEYEWSGLNYFNIIGKAGNAAKANDTPTNAWWHIIRCNHANPAGYYTDLAIPFNERSIYYKRITSGTVQNGGWVKVLDALNYQDYALPITGGTVTGDLTIKNNTGGNISLTFNRVNNANWKILNAGGDLKFQTDFTTSKGDYFDVLALDYNTGNATFKGVVKAPQFNGKATSAGTADSATDATTATRLSSNAGSANQPVYFSGGKPVAITSYSGNSATATKANWLYNTDTRDTNQPPSWYMENYPRGMVTEFKRRNIVHTPTDREYAELITHIPWNDASGGLPVQVAYNTGGISYREGTNETTWGSWKTLLNSGNYTSYTVTKTGSGASGTWGINISGNAATATKLQTVRTINGTNFDGTEPITTINWGTARKITIGGTEKSVNGSENVAWSLAEIGAVNKAGDTVTGALTINGALETKSTLKAAGAATLSSTLGVAGKITGSNGLEVTGATKILSTTGKNGTLDVDGATALKSTLNVTGIITGSDEIRSTAVNVLRAIYGNYGFIIRNDGRDIWFLLTDSGAQTGLYNNFRPFRINCSTGNVTIGTPLEASNTLAVKGTSTFTGRTIHEGKITIPSTGGTWISGKTGTNASINISTVQTDSHYHPYLAVTAKDGHVFNIGGYVNHVGFYGYYSDRKENGNDWHFYVNTYNGNWYCNKNITATGGFTGNLTGNADTATKLTSSAGSITTPIYFKDGVPVAITGSISNNTTGNAATAGTADKLGTSTVGSGTKPIYLNSGTAAASSSTVGSDTTPVYLNSGTITALQTELRKYYGSLASSGWKSLGGRASWAGITASYNNSAPTWLSDQYSSTVVFGSFDTKGYIDTSYRSPIFTVGGGSVSNSTDDAPRWYMKFSGTSGATYTLPGSSKTLAANDGSNASGSWGISISGNATSATQLQTARTIGLSGGATGTATSFNGTANISIPVTEVKEAYLSWGGKNFAANFGPIDAAMIPDLGANRFAFGKPAGVTIEYSTDAGSTWADYGATDAQKKALFGAGGADLIIGKNTTNGAGDLNKQLRITIKTVHFGIYTVLNKFAIDVSTSRSTGCWCSIDIALESTPTTWVNAANKVTIDGWNGWNIINVSAFTTYGNNASSQYGRIRFTFGCTGTTSDDYLGLKVNRIMAFGGMGWTAPSSMAKRGTIYDYDSDQNVTFPARVTANGAIKSNTQVQIGNLAWVKESDGSYSLKTV